MKDRATFMCQLAAGLCGWGRWQDHCCLRAGRARVSGSNHRLGGRWPLTISLGDADLSATQGLAHSLQIDGVVAR